MLRDLVMALVTARTKKQREKAYRNLERVGMDRATADVLTAGFRKKADAKEAES